MFAPKKSAGKGPARQAEPSHNSRNAKKHSSQTLFDGPEEVNIHGGDFTAMGPSNIVVNVHHPISSSSRRQNSVHDPERSAGRFPISERFAMGNAPLYAHSPRPDFHVYHDQLIVKGRGSPLWLPGPSISLPNEYRRSGVALGDVGILSASGAFDFLFNIFLPANHPINRGNVPASFVPLSHDIVKGHVAEHTVYDKESYLASANVRKALNATSPNLVFETCSTEGAVLTMPCGASSKDVLNVGRLRSYMSRNLAEWYKYANDDCGREAGNGDIRLVYGCDKASAWGIATFASNFEQDVRLEFMPEEDVLDGVTRNYTWKCVGTACGRAGPANSEMQDLREDNDDSKPSIRNQCLFVRTLNSTLRNDVWRELASEWVPSDDDSRLIEQGFSPSSKTSQGRKSASPKLPSARASSNSYRGSRQCSADTIGFSPVIHPSTALNKYLLQEHPDVDIVITEDAHWISALGEDGVPDHAELLKKVLMSYEVRKSQGVLYLEQKGLSICGGEHVAGFETASRDQALEKNTLGYHPAGLAPEESLLSRWFKLIPFGSTTLSSEKALESTPLVYANRTPDPIPENFITSQLDRMTGGPRQPKLSHFTRSNAATAPETSGPDDITCTPAEASVMDNFKHPITPTPPLRPDIDKPGARRHEGVEPCPKLSRSAKQPHASFSVPSVNHWDTLFKLGREYDEERCSRWRDQLDTLLIFAALFSAVVSGFVIESISQGRQALQDEYLRHISLQADRSLAAFAANSTAPTFWMFIDGNTELRSPTSVVRQQIAFLLSLMFSLGTAVVGIICSQWVREYRRDTWLLGPKEGSSLRQMRRDGINCWNVPFLIGSLPIFLQLSIAFFLWGITEYLWALGDTGTVLNVVFLWLGCLFLVVGTLTVPALQAIFLARRAMKRYQAPFKSPQARWFAIGAFWFARGVISFLLMWSPRNHFLQHKQSFLRKLSNALMDASDDWIAFDIAWKEEEFVRVDGISEPEGPHSPRFMPCLAQHPSPSARTIAPMYGHLKESSPSSPFKVLRDLGRRVHPPPHADRLVDEWGQMSRMMTWDPMLSVEDVLVDVNKAPFLYQLPKNNTDYSSAIDTRVDPRTDLFVRTLNPNTPSHNRGHDSGHLNISKNCSGPIEEWQDETLQVEGDKWDMVSMAPFSRAEDFLRVRDDLETQLVIILKACLRMTAFRDILWANTLPLVLKNVVYPHPELAREFLSEISSLNGDLITVLQEVDTNLLHAVRRQALAHLLLYIEVYEQMRAVFLTHLRAISDDNVRQEHQSILLEFDEQMEGLKRCVGALDNGLLKKLNGSLALSTLNVEMLSERYRN